MKLDLLRNLTAPAILTVAMLWSSVLYGQAKIEIDKDRWVSVGGAIRTSFRTTETGPGSGDYVQKISLENARLYFNGQPHKDFQVEFNAVFSEPDTPRRRPGTANQLQVLDAVVKYAPKTYFNVWMGRHLRPSDRSSLDTPYFLSIYDFPDLVYHYPVTFVGLRDNGVSVSGQVDNGRLKYAFGMYDGARNVLGQNDNLLYAARATVNLLDPEPGYYNRSTYYGEKNILAVGFAIQHQGDIVIDNAGAPPITA